jgi:hypothetical protein
LMPTSRASCKLLYSFCKIRGEKVIVRFFSTETKHLELLLSAIEIGTPSDATKTLGKDSPNIASEENSGHSAQDEDMWGWEERYIALLWLSQLLLAPFDLASISSEQSRSITPPLIANLDWPPNVPALALRVIPLSIRYLSSSSKESASAKLLLVRVAMRRDMQELGVFDALLHWALRSLDSFLSTSASIYHYTSILSFVGGLLVASVGTTVMNSYLNGISEAMEKILEVEDSSSYLYGIKQSPVARKAIVKILRQAAVLSLQDSANLESSAVIENSIGVLLEMLSDTATHVRLAVSKALSVIAVKLDPGLAHEVVDAILEALEKNTLSLRDSVYKVEDLSRVDQNEWHGLIMTLSHLLYRHSIPAKDLPPIIEALRRGLSFEQRSSTGASLGLNVRDAANFGMWSLARRYSTSELQTTTSKSSELRWDDRDNEAAIPVLQGLATQLVVTASLDSAGNVRRGSSAALQELIGRHPDVVENGIAVVQAVDYHAVALRSRAILEVGPAAAVWSKHYRVAILTALMGWRGVKDSDTLARRNAACAVGRILFGYAHSNDEAYNPWNGLLYNIMVIETHLKLLEPRDVETQHGLLLCLAEILTHIFPDCSGCMSVGKICLSHSPEIILDKPPDAVKSGLVSHIRNVLDKILLACRSSGRRPELLAEAASKFLIKSLRIFPHGSISSNQETSDSELSMLTTANTIILQLLRGGHPDSLRPVSTAAATLIFYLDLDTQKKLSELIIKGATDTSTGKGAVCLHTIFQLFGSVTNVDVLSHKSLVDIVKKRWGAQKPPDLAIREVILECLSTYNLPRDVKGWFIDLIGAGLCDYTTSARGDVGSKLRIAAAKAATTFMIIPTPDRSNTSDIIDGESELFSRVLRAAAEKLDKVRAEAQRALISAIKERLVTREKWLAHPAAVPDIALSKIDNIVSQLRTLSCSSKEWFLWLLALQNASWWKAGVHKWSWNLLAGYITSAGAGSEDVVRASRAALVEFCSVRVQEDDHEDDETFLERVDPNHLIRTTRTKIEFRNEILICVTLIDIANWAISVADEKLLVASLETFAFLIDAGIFQDSKN